MEESRNQCLQGDSTQSQSQALLREVADDGVDETHGTVIGTSADRKESESITAGDNAKDEKERKIIEANSYTDNEAPKEDDVETTSTPEFVFGRWAVYVCAVGNFGLSISLPLAMSALFLDWQDAFQVTRAHTVAVHSTTVGILFGGAIIPGYLMNRFGARFTVLMGSFLASFGCFISCFATSINYLIVSVGILGGLGFSFINLPSMPAITTAFTPKYRGIAVAVCTCGSAVCNMGFPYLYRHLVHHYTWRGAFAFISGLCLQTVIMGLVMTSLVKRSYLSRKTLALDVLDETESHPVFNNQTADAKKSKTEDSQKSCNIDGKNHDDCKGNEINSKTPVDKEFSQQEERDLKRESLLLRLRAVPPRIKKSKWNFIFDFYYILIICNVCTCMPSVISFILFIMDYAADRGFHDDSTGVFFLFILFICSLSGRLIIGILSIVPYLHSIILMGAYGIIASSALIVLGSATQYSTIVAFLVVFGVGAGGAIAIYTKCVLDVDSVTRRTYPLALGLAGTMEGIFDLVLPIFIGYSVDRTGSYTMIYHLLGSISLTTSFIILVFKSVSTYKTYQEKTKDVKNVT